MSPTVRRAGFPGSAAPAGFEGLRAAGLLKPGSLINFHYRLKLPTENARGRMAEIARGAENTFPNAGWRIRDRFDASPSLRRFVERLGLFLTLVGLTALVVGGVGVGNAITAYLERRRETIAIIKALGGSGRFIFKIYALQISLFSIGAIALGLGLGAVAPFGVQTLFGSILPVTLVPDIYAEPLLAAAGFGVLSAAGFAFWPLGKVEKVSVGSLFRQSVDARAVAPARRYLFAIGLCFAGLLVLAMTIAQRTDIAVWFAVGVGSYLALRATAWLLVKLVRLAGRRVSPNAPCHEQHYPPECAGARRGFVNGPFGNASVDHFNAGRQYQRPNQRRSAERTPSFSFSIFNPTKSMGSRSLWRRPTA